MSANLTMTDLFCGAGGSSTGAVSVPGVEVRLAANHWDRAIETHNQNHPDTDHLQADISNTDPRYVPTTDLLWASPECTNHSRAKGRKLAGQQPDLFGDVLPEEAAERSRATMWDVVRFAEAHHYKAVLVENVVEVVDWSSPWGERGGLFRSWLGAMHALGYRHRVVSMNSMHAQAHGLPAPQSRDRVYIAFWRAGDRAPDFERMQRPKAYCARCDQIVDAMQWWKKGDGQARPGRYRSQYLYRCPNIACRNDVVEPAWLPAASIIDWSNPGTRIGDRAKPLAEKTMRRIQVGIERYWSPIHVEHGGNQYDAADPKHPGFGDPGSYYRAWPASEPLRTMHTRESKAIAYTPVMVPVEGRDGKQPMTMVDPLRTQTTRNESGLAFPPFLAELRGGGSTARRASDPLATVTASGNHHGLVMTNAHSNRARPVSEAMPTMTTAGGGGHALIHRHNGGGPEMTTPAGEPIRTVTTTGHQSVLTGQTVDIADVRFRMLEPDEIKQAMAFPREYLMAGNRREQVKLSGNAVTPPAARDLIATVTTALTGEEAA
ncbi:DNA (cytosine-5)-methyltransferase 1 [Sediminihabitans luteus]|uniref:DNA (cytosine-5-)-methyltransferase n=1 Tax=Sediminihabitans luteus TaxID=1138585 RepID=A0A2M9CZX6_9CELL|nr:DNA cytosine methyltransferase [Sediminihabitans luteus]PJJ77470.1 DNA (cytosine-5)-methyltransferase 1 [Sediminihabitans luteus]GII98364.1 DNA cytosine methyltransferase [Sediminihabitans luteus]